MVQKSFSAIVQQTRTPNAVPPFAAFLVGFFYAQPVAKATALALVGAICMALLLFYANLQNDLIDYEIDRFGNRSTPLIAGQLSKQTVALAAYGSLAIAVILAGATRHPVLIGGVIMCAILYTAYNLPPVRLAARPVLSIISLGILYGGLPCIVGFLVVDRSLSPGIILLSTGLFVHRVSISILKDYKDYQADKRYDKRTFLQRYGFAGTRTTSLVAALLGFACIVLGAISNGLAGPRQWVLGLGLLGCAGIMIVWRWRLGKTKNSLSANAPLFQRIFDLALFFDTGLLLWFYIS